MVRALMEIILVYGLYMSGGEKKSLSDRIEETTLKIRAWSLPTAMLKGAEVLTP